MDKAEMKLRSVRLSSTVEFSGKTINGRLSDHTGRENELTHRERDFDLLWLVDQGLIVATAKGNGARALIPLTNVASFEPFGDEAKMKGRTR